MNNTGAWGLLFELADEEDTLDANRKLRLERRRIRDTDNAMELPEARFIELFRLNKYLMDMLVEKLGPYLRSPDRLTGIPVDLKVLAAVRYFATGSYQRSTGQDFVLGLSQTSMSRIIEEVSFAIDEKLADDWICFPETEEDKQAIKDAFFRVAGFPGIIGAIDCTHVVILKPEYDEQNYVNRYKYHSANVQIICDFGLNILAINPKYAGATHDSAIWQMSSVNAIMEEDFNNGDHNSWLIGDSGYPLRPWVMTPISNAVENTPQENYNVAHRKTRNVIERLNGVLKARWRCLSDDNKLRYHPDKVSRIINACATLHNMCTAHNVPITEPIVITSLQDDDNEVTGRNYRITEGRRIQGLIVDQYFT